MEVRKHYKVVEISGNFIVLVDDGAGDLDYYGELDHTVANLFNMLDL